MDRISEIFDALKPHILGLIEQAVQLSGTSGGSGNTSGVLDASQYPDALLRDGSRTLLQSLGVADGALLDGRDVSVDGGTLDTLGSSFASHAAQNAVAAHGSVGAHDHTTPASGGQLDHGGLGGLGDDDHTGYAGAVGSSINRAAKDVDGTIIKTWTGVHTFNQTTQLSNAIPRTNDTYDLGSETLRWRQAFVSELETILLKQKAVIAVDGAIILGKQNGSFNDDITTSQTQIDFGTTMTPNDFLYVSGNNKTEYMQVGTLVSGTTYNVTRNVDGSGADAWTSGQAWISFGYNGDTRIELSKASGLRLLRQGTMYSNVTEIVTLDADGLSVIVGTTGSDLQSYKFTDSSGTILSRIAAYLIGASNYLETKVEKANANNQVSVTAKSTTGYAATSDIIAGQGGKLALVRASIDTTGLAQSIASADRHQWQLDRFSPASSHVFTGALTDEYVWNTVFRSWFWYDGTSYHQISVPTFNGAFPASPRDKMRVFRSDLKLEFYWDASSGVSGEWLSTEIFEAVIVETRVLSPYTNANIGTTDTFVTIYHIDNRTFGCRILDSYFYYQLGATNDASNTYTYRIDISANGGTASNIITETSLAPKPINDKGVIIIPSTLVSQNTNGARSSIILKKVGTPTGLTFRGIVKYRLVG